MTALKPGQIVTHPEHGLGLTVWDLVQDRTLVMHGTTGAIEDDDLTGWTPVETLPAGHIAVRVDDLHEARPPIDRLNHRARMAWEAWAKQRKPAQPDEPTHFAARVTLTHPSGGKVRFARQHDGYWASKRGELVDWPGLCRMGAVTIGWDD